MGGSITEFLFSPTGRVSLSEFWLKWLLPYTVVDIILGLIVIRSGMDQIAATIVFGIFVLVTLWPAVVIYIKRSHDRGRSGWFILLSLVPIVGLWPLVELFLLPGTAGTNRYGSDPHPSQRRWMGWVYAGVGLSLLAIYVGGAVFAVFYLTAGGVTAADEFFRTIADAGPAAAYQKASPSFRAAQSEADFTAWAERLGLKGYQSASWSNRRWELGDTVDLSGKLTLTGGGTLPTTVTLTKGNAGVWQVTGVDIRAGIAAQSGKPSLPNDAALTELASTTVAGFSDAVRTGDFTVFYAQISRFWQAQTTAEKLRDAFAQFVEQKPDLSGAAAVGPVFSVPPAIDADRKLDLKGYFPTNPQTWYFEFQYTYEHPAWKLVGINVSTKKN